MSRCHSSSTPTPRHHSAASVQSQKASVRPRPREGRSGTTDLHRRAHYSRQRRYDYLFTVVNPPELSELEETMTAWLGDPSND